LLSESCANKNFTENIQNLLSAQHAFQLSYNNKKKQNIMISTTTQAVNIETNEKSMKNKLIRATILID